MRRGPVERTLGRFLKQSLINITIPASQCRVDDLVSEVKRIDQVDGFETNSSQQERVPRLQRQNLLFRQIRILKEMHVFPLNINK